MNICLLTCRHEEHYSWNKATSCVHNILGGQRWVEHYGEVTITNHKLDIVCKLTLAKVTILIVAVCLFICFVHCARNHWPGNCCHGDTNILHYLVGALCERHLPE